MKIGAIILCRMDSTRLPGKTLLPVFGRPLIWYVVSRVSAMAALTNRVVIATSSRPDDDPIADFCRERQIPVFRGELDDVAGRTLECAKTFGFDAFFRLNGDSPFVDADLLDRAQYMMKGSDYDLITNLKPRSYPYGVSVELIKTLAFADVYQQITSASEREHITKHFYLHADNYRIANLSRHGKDLSNLCMTIDTSEHLKAFSHFVSIQAGNWLGVAMSEAISYYEGNGAYAQHLLRAS